MKYTLNINKVLQNKIYIDVQMERKKKYKRREVAEVANGRFEING